MPESGPSHPPTPALAALVARHLGPWARQASCAGENPDIFFPPKTSPGTEAREICQRCPVRQDCLDYAMRADIRYGIWGGLDENERHSLRRKQARSRSRGQGGRRPAGSWTDMSIAGCRMILIFLAGDPAMQGSTTQRLMGTSLLCPRDERG
jgi:hypothetical protein